MKLLPAEAAVQAGIYADSFLPHKAQQEMGRPKTEEKLKQDKRTRLLLVRLIGEFVS